MRSRYIDNLKGVSIIFVVLFHTIKASLGQDYVTNILANVLQPPLVPMFFVVAGYLMHGSQNLVPGKWLGNRALYLLIPHVVMNALWYVGALAGTAIDSALIRAVPFGLWMLKSTFGACGEVFFLCLFCTLTILLNLVLIERRNSTLTFWMYLLGSSVVVMGLPPVAMFVPQFQWYYLFAILGFLIARYQLVVRLRPFRWLVILGVVLYLPALWLSGWHGGWVSRGIMGVLMWLYNHDYTTAPLVMLQVLLGLCVISVIAGRLRTNSIALIGRYSFAVYFFHIPICALGFGSGWIRIASDFVMVCSCCFAVVLGLSYVSQLRRWIPLRSSAVRYYS